MKLNKIFWASCAVIGTFALSSCEKYDELFPEQYHRVLNIKNAGISSVDLYTIDGESAVEISVMKTGSEEKATATGTLAAMTEEAFNTYCSNNNLLYTYLPADCYELKNNDLQFAESERYKFVEAVMNIIAINDVMEQNPEKTYALPLKLSSTDASVNDSLLILLPNVTAPALGFTTSGFVSAANFTSAGESTVSTSLQLEIPQENTWGLKCKVVSNEFAKEQFEQYNAQNENRYTLLPDDAYTLDANGELTFADGATSAGLNITFNRSKIGVGEYILPLAIDNVSKDGFDYENAGGVVMLGVVFSPDKIDLTVDQFSANSVQNGDGTGLMGLIDGRGAGLHFHSIWGAPIGDPVYGNYIDVALKSPLTKVKFDYWTRFENGAAAPTHIKIFVSSDNVSWNELGDISSGLPTGADQQYSSRIYTSETQFNYFRFAVLRSVAGDLTKGSWFNLGEFALYGE